MKKLFLSILVLGLLWCNIGFAETVEERLSKIEKRLEKKLKKNILDSLIRIFIL